ncbi:MAG: signal peptide peptidase SppA [Acidobacteria bacterium]|nr:signal peptide peptidase SppA [Acidobacteriota bacterium]
MPIVDILSSPWAIVPEKLQEICAIYRAHARGEKADLAAIEAATGKKLDNQPKTYIVRDRVAILPIEGIISKRMNLFTRISGGISTQLFQRDLQVAAEDPEVDSIVLLIDSPGGTVDGTQPAMQAVRDARQQKRVIAVADGQMMSAAYWIGSAAEQIFIVDDTTHAGSIGVVATHEDWSKYEERIGIKTTEIAAGRYKRIASEYAPLSPEGRATIQERVDQIYTIFVNDVAANRGVGVETVLKEMADGRMFIGQKAVMAGLVDGIKTVSAVIAQLNEPAGNTRNGAFAPKQGETTMEKTIVCGVECTTQEQVDAATKDAIEKAVNDARAGAESEAAEKLAKAKEEGISEGAAAERKRILAVEANAMAGHEKLVKEMVDDGKTTGPEAAERILAAEKAKTKQVAADLAADAPPPAPASEATETTSKDKEDNREIARAAQDYVEEQAKKGRKVSYSEAVQHVRKERQ